MDTGLCSCVDGYTGTLCETDINECESGPCLNGGTCQQLFSGGFQCRCSAFFIGDLCEIREMHLLHALSLSTIYICLCVESHMYSYGDSQGDTRLDRRDDLAFGPIPIDLFCFPFASKRHQSFYVGLLCTS